MSRYEEACPYEAPARASRCETCCATNTLTPCVAAYLSGKVAVPPSNVISIRRVEAVEARKAA